jgi:hypothetical protein
MRTNKNKSQASLVLSGVVGMCDRQKEICKVCDEFEKIFKKLAKINNLDIRVSVQVWELK